MMWALRHLLLGALLVTVGHCFALELQGRIIGVLDGDTVDLLTQGKELVRVRLSGIDAPEKRQAFGNAAKKALSDLAFDRQVRVDGGKRDRYGRFIGKILLNGTDVNLQMVNRGYAWHYVKYEKEQMLEDRLIYRAAEALAKSRRLGLWDDKDPVAPWEFRAARKTHVESSRMDALPSM